MGVLTICVAARPERVTPPLEKGPPEGRSPPQVAGRCERSEHLAACQPTRSFGTS